MYGQWNAATVLWANIVVNTDFCGFVPHYSTSLDYVRIEETTGFSQNHWQLSGVGRAVYTASASLSVNLRSGLYGTSAGLTVSSSAAYLALIIKLSSVLHALTLLLLLFSCYDYRITTCLGVTDLFQTWMDLNFIPACFSLFSAFIFLWIYIKKVAYHITDWHNLQNLQQLF